MDFLDFFGFFGFLDVTTNSYQWTTGHQKLSKMGQISIIPSFFLPKGEKKPRPKAKALRRREK